MYFISPLQNFGYRHEASAKSFKAAASETHLFDFWVINKVDIHTAVVRYWNSKSNFVCQNQFVQGDLPRP